MIIRGYDKTQQNYKLLNCVIKSINKFSQSDLIINIYLIKKNNNNSTFNFVKCPKANITKGKQAQLKSFHLNSHTMQYYLLASPYSTALESVGVISSLSIVASHFPAIFKSSVIVHRLKLCQTSLSRMQCLISVSLKKQRRFSRRMRMMFSFVFNAQLKNATFKGQKYIRQTICIN